jgi:hypothetical protein
MLVGGCVLSRLLVRVLKEGVQFWYNDTSTVKMGGGGGGGGVRENVPLENLWSLIVYVTSWQYLFQARSKFFKHTSPGFMSLCRYASLLNYDIFIQPGTPSNWSKCQMNNENWSYYVSDIFNILREIIENNFPFSPEFGRPKASIFCSRGVSAVRRRPEFCRSSGGFLPAGAGAAVLSSQLRLEN